MFAKKDNSRYKSGYVDKSPDELPGVKKKIIYSPSCRWRNMV